MNASRLLVAALALAACSAGSTGEPPQEGGAGEETTMVNEGEDDATPGKEATAGSTETATFGAGCFWCVEAVLEQLDGVIDVRSGYMGGEIQNPTYAQVCSGTSGHAEVVQLDYDPSRISYATLLDWFWRLHDPTTLNRQGGDFGTQYRSAVYYHSPEQRAAAEKSKQDAGGSFDDPIVTEITQAGTFYEADAHHQDYYRANKSQPYCRVVIRPKLDKLHLEK